jgi:hypothetical protein
MWGKRAGWVDYQGILDGNRLGIAILNHPSSYGYPTYWHVRDYGRFAANPFGVHDFAGGAPSEGAVIVEQNNSLNLHYRVIFHRSDENEAKIEEYFQK